LSVVCVGLEIWANNSGGFVGIDIGVSVGSGIGISIDVDIIGNQMRGNWFSLLGVKLFFKSVNVKLYPCVEAVGAWACCCCCYLSDKSRGFSR
jgi:hypothetical protein